LKPILFHLQHLFGSGHVQRVRVLSEVLARKGYPVALISGGLEHPVLTESSIRLFQLPGIKADNDLGKLVDLDGNCVNDDLWEQRSLLIRQIVLEVKPAMIITEGFPFARRRFSREILEMFDTARTELKLPTMNLCSVRDIVQPIQCPDRQNQVIKTLNEYYDHILVHGEPSFVPLQLSFPRLDKISKPITYTGYLNTAIRSHRPVNRTSGQVLVSAGGGIVGQAIYKTAIQAASSFQGADWKWHILIGNSVSDSDFIGWRQIAPNNLILERNRADFRQLLASCEVSVSQIGYNTAVDLVETGTQGIVIPYEADGEKEQMMRAKALIEYNHVKVLKESELSEVTLINAISEVMSQSKKLFAPFRSDGIERFLDIIDSIYPIYA